MEVTTQELNEEVNGTDADKTGQNSMKEFMFISNNPTKITTTAQSSINKNIKEKYTSLRIKSTQITNNKKIGKK